MFFASYVSDRPTPAEVLLYYTLRYAINVVKQKNPNKFLTLQDMKSLTFNQYA